MGKRFGSMKVGKTEIPGVLLIQPDVYEDRRGYFFESYNREIFLSEGLDIRFVQDNESKSGFGVIRGLHYQLAPFAQTKLIRVLDGEIMDIVVDIRKNSPAYSRWLGTRLNARNRTQLLVPRGFAHGFAVLTESAVVSYKCDNYYHPEAERGIIFNDPDLNIDWGVDPEKAIISPKDRLHPPFSEAETNFKFGATEF